MANNLERVGFVAHGGKVQGVGFRYFTRERAQEYGITGWCRNTTDNKVEGEAQGQRDTLDKLLKDIDQGPRGAKVVDVTTERKDVIEGESVFEVRR
ncbi:acylphosphatase [Emericellopsis atlantica]|uniref:acylphosphatase n=1 Tax=Emericellopsis atlantica TaxID=2614577 RepID=A0A9P7ZUA7_9HYPO|nr:acylphosphatase [Emericellopsis atlantica]KAG9257962.1 acylphosphatase [Emericellopsis atlantica]